MPADTAGAVGDCLIEVTVAIAAAAMAAEVGVKCGTMTAPGTPPPLPPRLPDSDDGGGCEADETANWWLTDATRDAAAAAATGWDNIAPATEQLNQ